MFTVDPARAAQARWSDPACGGLAEMGAILPLTDWLGWSAEGLSLLTFPCNDLVRLRDLAQSAKAAWIACGLTAWKGEHSELDARSSEVSENRQWRAPAAPCRQLAPYRASRSALSDREC